MLLLMATEINLKNCEYITEKKSILVPILKMEAKNILEHRNNNKTQREYC